MSPEEVTTWELIMDSNPSIRERSAWVRTLIYIRALPEAEGVNS